MKKAKYSTVWSQDTILLHSCNSEEGLNDIWYLNGMKNDHLREKNNEMLEIILIQPGSCLPWSYSFICVCITLSVVILAAYLLAGKETESYIHFANGGSDNFIINSIDASFRYPQDFSYIMQNVS